MPSQHRPTWACLIATVVVLTGRPVAAQPPQPTASRHLRAQELTDAPTIDGRIDEAAWRQASWASDFVERRPVRGGVPPVGTSFAVAFDEDALYLAIRCQLAEGETPRMAELTRDSFGVFSDDAISIKIDVRHDRRNTVGFVVNAAGAQLDYVAIDNGRSFRREYDAVWESATNVQEHEFTIEMRLPVHALGLSRMDGARILGLELSRDHNARRATYDWAPIPIEFGAFSALHYGELEVPGQMAGGRQLTLIPYLVAGIREDDLSRFPPDSPWVVAAGLDARLRLGEDIWGEVTALTDFSQVDLDDPAVNLDRFPLFFPERRPFFLTGLDVFNFGDSGVAQPFFSRRIGIGDDRSEILMLGGAKVYGRATLRGGRSLGFGLLEALTLDEALDSTTVARMRLNFGEASYVGAIGTLLAGGIRDSDGTAGADFLARSGRFQISGFATGSYGPKETEDDTLVREFGAAAQVQMRWRGEVFRPVVTARWIDEEFAPAVGFVRRRDIFELNGDLQIQHRTSALGLERLDVYLSANQLWDSAFDRDVGRTFGGELSLSWVAGYDYSLSVEAVHDVVDEAFDIVGREVQPGEYDGVRFRTSFSRSDVRNPNFNISYTGQASFFGGVRQTFSAGFGFFATGHFRLSVSGSGNFINLPGSEPFAAWTGSAQIVVAPTTTLQLDAAFQINTASEELRTLARIRWRYVPGSDIFVVYRESRPYGDDGELERRALLKWLYRFDALL